MNPEEADRLWYEEMRKADWHKTSGHPETQHEMRMRCWMVLMAHIRKVYQEENERLREENRALKMGFLNQIEEDAKR